MSAAPSIDIIRTTTALRSRIGEWRRDGLRVGLVPTMGALHTGHFSLVKRSIESTDRTCVTLFVNPKQFGPGEDLEQYPRDEEADAAALASEGAHLLFAPSLDEMYPDGFSTLVSVAGIGDKLEGRFRPGFFEGVATVVTKLLLQALPDAAFFGEKDFQQLCVVRRAVADLSLPVEIVGCPTVREADGLAISSRNAYLSAEDRAAAPALLEIMGELRDRVRRGEAVGDATPWAQRALLSRGFTKVDYLSVYDVESFEPASDTGSQSRILAAAWLGGTRLIDNLPLTE